MNEMERGQHGHDWKALAYDELLARYELEQIDESELTRLALERGMEIGRQERRDRAVVLREMYEQRTRDTPGFPDEQTMRRAVELVVEEALELVLGLVAHSYLVPGTESTTVDVVRYAEASLLDIVRNCDLRPDLPAIADALEDIDVTVESARCAFGIDGEPIATAVFNANATKAGGPVDPVTGKRLKPPGFQPPDIKAELRKQEWKP